MLVGLGPSGGISWPAPALQNIALSIKLHNGRSGDAAVGAGRRGGCAGFIGLDIARAADDPNVIVLVGHKDGNALQDPFMRQGLGPEWIHFIDGHIFRPTLCARRLNS